MSVTLGKLYRPKKIRDPTVHDQGRGGGARGILDVESDVFFGLTICTLGIFWVKRSVMCFMRS